MKLHSICDIITNSSQEMIFLSYIVCTIAALAYADVKDFIFKDPFGNPDPAAWAFYIMLWPVILLFIFFRWAFSVILGVKK